MKGLVDSHIHSFFSGDCEMDPELIIKKALEQGLSGIAITDHMDIDYPILDVNFNLDLEEFSKFYDLLKLKYKNDIILLKGIEVGLQEHIVKDNIEAILKYDFDFIIGSIHVVDKLDLHVGDFCRNKTKKQSYDRFFEKTYANLLTFNNYDVLGHLDIIRRYGDYEDKSLAYSEYKESIDIILKHLIKNDKGIEVNTSGFRYNLNSTCPGYDVINRYYELGGKIITIGSDSHTYEYLGYGFSNVEKNLKDIGFNSIAYFENRKPKFIKI